MELNSPIPRLLETNGPPSSEEVNVVLTSIQTTKIFLSSIHRQLSLGQGMNFEERFVLDNRLRSCHNFIRQQYGAISVLRSLPNEILSAIFAFACEQSGPSLTTPRHIGHIQPQIGLSRVCRRWRHVILQTPELWANIPTCGIAGTLSQPNPQVIETYIQRSGAAPLNISLCLRLSTLLEGTTEDWQSVLLVLSHAERWRNLDLTTTDAGLRYLHYQTRIQDRLAHLEALTIHLPLTEVISPDQVSHHDVFLNTPSLRSLRIAVQSSVGRVLAFPWSTLHSFHGVLPVDAPLGSNFHCVSAVLDPFDHLQINPKPGLRVLHVDPSTASPNFTLNKDFPDLEALKLVNTSPDMLMTSLRRMNTNSARISKTESLVNLTTLEFSTPQVDQAALASFLEWTPRVTSLTLRNFHTNMLEVFSRSNPVILPDMTSLRISQQKNTNPKVFARLLTDIITSRKGAAPSIECHLPRDHCLSVLYVLEGLEAREKAGESETLRLEAYYMDLVLCVFGRSDGSRIKNADRRIEHFRSTLPQKWLMMHYLLEAVESLAIIDALNLEKSNLANVIADIATIPAGLILDEYYYNFQRRAQDILRRWQPLLDLLRKDRKWVLNEEDRGVLCYSARNGDSMHDLLSL